MSKTVKVTYNADTLETTIVVDGKEFDTSRIKGKEIADWAYPFMVRKVRWDGFYDEMVTALGGEKAFDLVFEGSEEALAELKEAWEDAPVNVVSGEQGNTVTIMYDADALTTEITVNGQVFDTSRINGKEIEDWVYPFMMRKVKWDGIFDELKKALDTDEYDILFSGTRAAMKALMEDCPETVSISLQRGTKPAQSKNETPIKPVSSSKTVSRIIEYDSDKVIELWNNDEYNTALAIVRPAAESGNMEAQGDLGLMYQFGWGVDIDISAALKWYLKAAEQGDAACMESVAEIYAGIIKGSESLKNPSKAEEWFKKAEKEVTEKDCFDYCNYYNFLLDEGKEKEAIAVMKRGANKGDVDAMRDLANAYYWGEDYGVSQDLVEAGEWFEKAADVGDAIAMMRVGEFYLYAQGNFPEDNDEAFRYLTEAVEKDDDLPLAHEMLGKCYLNGWGTNEDNKKAKEHFMKAANADSAEAMYCLGILYRDNGTGSEATKWLQKAADNDCIDGLLALGYMYLYGNAIKQNYQQAVNCFKKATDMGNSEAALCLGDCYKFGKGVAQSDEEALRCYAKSAELGNLDAQFEVGCCLYHGEGIQANRLAAFELYFNSAESGNLVAKEMLEFLSEEGDQTAFEFYKKISPMAEKHKPRQKNPKPQTRRTQYAPSFIDKASTYLKTDQGKEFLKKTGIGAAKGAAKGLAKGGGWTSVVGGAVTGAASAAITSLCDDDE